MPTLLVVDDVQDLTLGGLALLAVLQGLGVHLVLFGDPDEAVQAFRGSYPEYLYARFLDPNGPFAADHVSLQAFQHEPATYRDIVASRVSLSIASAEESSLPLAQRPGKLPAVEGPGPPAPARCQRPAYQEGAGRRFSQRQTVPVGKRRTRQHRVADFGAASERQERDMERHGRDLP